MQNILNEQPQEKLEGRLLFSTKFVNKSDIAQKKILDIGCGYGWFEKWSEKQGVKKIVGTEINADTIKKVKSFYRSKNVAFEKASATKLPFPDASFDTVVSFEVIEHIPKKTEDLMFSEVNRVLDKDGVFYLSTPFNHILSKVLDPAWWLIGHRHYSYKYFVNIAKRHGFKIEKYTVRGRLWELMTVLNLYISKWIFRRGILLEDYFQNKRNNEYKRHGYAIIFLKFRKLT